MKPRVAVAIVNADAGEQLERTLEALGLQTVAPTRTILVDNASSDGSADGVELRHPGLEVVRLAENVGFAAANNLAVARADDCEWVALLNPDAFPDPDWLESLLAATEERDDCAALGSTLVLASDPTRLDGTGDLYHVSGFAWRRDHGRPVAEGPKRPQEVFSVCAAAALYRRAAFVAVGGFDESFFCYYEDTDLAFRLRLRGGRSVHVPVAIVRHVGSATTGRESEFTLYHWSRNRLWTYAKSMPAPLLGLYLPQFLLVTALILAWSAARGQAGAALRAQRDALRGLPRVLRERQAIRSMRTIGMLELRRSLTRGPAVYRVVAGRASAAATGTVAWNTGVQVLARVTTLAFSLVTTVLLTRHLGVAGYGSYVTALVYLSFFGCFADCGTQTMLVRDLSRDGVDAAASAGTALALRLGLAVAAAGGAVLLLPFLFGDQRQVRVAVLVALPTLLTATVTATATSVLQARRRMGGVAVAEIVSQGLLAVLVVALVALDRPFPEIVASLVAAGAVQAAIALGLARRLVALTPRIEPALWAGLLRRSLPLGIALLLNTFYFRIDAVLLSALRGAAQTGAYGVAFRFTEATLAFPTFLVAAVFPLLAGAASGGDLDRLRAIAQRSLDALVLAAVPLGLGTIAVAPQIVHLLAGAGFGAAVTPLRILSLGAMLMFVNGLLGYVLIALDRQRDALWLNVAALVFNVGANLALIPRLGAVGAATAASASELLILAGALWLVRRYAGFRPAFGPSRRALAAGAAMAAVVGLAQLEIAFSIAVGALAYGAALLALRRGRPTRAVATAS